MPSPPGGGISTMRELYMEKNSRSRKKLVLLFACVSLAAAVAVYGRRVLEAYHDATAEAEDERDAA
jgi:hypothetical protein